MSKVEYILDLSPSLDNRLRIEFYKEKNEIVRFCIQYETYIKRRWHAVVRYDTSHGFAHKDTMHFDGSSEKQTLPFLTYNVALTYAIQDLKQNWHRYRRIFEEDLHD